VGRAARRLLEYILKPINEEALRETLLHAKNRILNRESLENKVSQMELQLEKRYLTRSGALLRIA
jgi:AmiR/NasT family two-component response regulator